MNKFYPLAVSTYQGCIPFSSHYVHICNFLWSGRRPVAVLCRALNLTCALSLAGGNAPPPHPERSCLAKGQPQKNKKLWFRGWRSSFLVLKCCHFKLTEFVLEYSFVLKPDFNRLLSDVLNLLQVYFYSDLYSSWLLLDAFTAYLSFFLPR